MPIGGLVGRNAPKIILNCSGWCIPTVHLTWLFRSEMPSITSEMEVEVCGDLSPSRGALVFMRCGAQGGPSSLRQLDEARLVVASPVGKVYPPLVAREIFHE